MWLAVGMEESSIKPIKYEIKSGEGDLMMGMLTFSDSPEVELPEPEQCLVKNNNLIGKKIGQLICTFPFVSDKVSVDFNIRTNDPKL